MSRPTPLDGTVPMQAALAGSEPLARLVQRLQASRERFAAIAELLPPGLADAVRPGPVDEDGWSLLAAHAAAAAKLRQLVPRLEQRLRERGWEATPIKVRIQPRQRPA